MLARARPGDREAAAPGRPGARARVGRLPLRDAPRAASIVSRCGRAAASWMVKGRLREVAKEAHGKRGAAAQGGPNGLERRTITADEVANDDSPGCVGTGGVAWPVDRRADQRQCKVRRGSCGPERQDCQVALQ